jgi:hypothetical protein
MYLLLDTILKYSIYYSYFQNTRTYLQLAVKKAKLGVFGLGENDGVY